MTAYRTGVVLRSKSDVQRAIEMLRKVKERHLPAEFCLKPYEPKRSVEANRYHWALLNRLAEHMASCMGGEYHAPEVWHEFCVKRFCGYETHEVCGETVSVRKSTSKMTVAEFSDLDRQIEAHFGTEHGFQSEDVS